MSVVIVVLRAVGLQGGFERQPKGPEIPRFHLVAPVSATRRHSYPVALFLRFPAPVRNDPPVSTSPLTPAFCFDATSYYLPTGSF